MSRFDDTAVVLAFPGTQSPMTSWHAPIQDWRVWLAAAGRPQSTIKLRTYQLGRFSRACRDPWAATTELMVGWLASQEWGLETKRSHRAALTTFYRWAHATGRIGHDPAALLPPIQPGQHLPRPAPEHVVADAIRGARADVALMLRLAAFQGLRRGEIARVHTGDVEPDAVGWSLRVFGKGRKERVVPLLDDIARALRARPAGFVFPGNDHGHLSPAWVGRLMSEALPQGWTAHTLRHRFGTSAYRGSRDLLAVQALLGHARPETTKRYVELSRDALRAAMLHAA